MTECESFQIQDGGSIPTSPLQKAHQRIIRDQKSMEITNELFDTVPKDIDIGKAEVRRVSFRTATKIIHEYEWLGNMAQRTTDTFGIYFDGFCGGVVCYSVPPTPQAAEGVCGKEYINIVKTLSRGACVHWAHEHAASKLISISLKMMIKETRFRIFVAYSDPRAGEIGTVYQATNWLYTGKTSGDIEYKLKDRWISGRSSRHKSYKRSSIDFSKLPSRIAEGKNRYIYIGGKEKESLMNNLKYTVYPYPKRREV